jgi:hypothetical protein
MSAAFEMRGFFAGSALTAVGAAKASINSAARTRMVDFMGRAPRLLSMTSGAGVEVEGPNALALPPDLGLKWLVAPRAMMRRPEGESHEADVVPPLRRARNLISLNVSTLRPFRRLGAAFCMHQGGTSKNN